MVYYLTHSVAGKLHDERHGQKKQCDKNFFLRRNEGEARSKCTKGDLFQI